VDKAALVAIMAYVDMNPLRAGMVETVEESEYTSLKASIEGREREQSVQPVPHSVKLHRTGKWPAVCDYLKDTPQAALLPFADQSKDSPI